VQQGSGAGDCWLLAGLAEVAARNPSAIKNMFTYSGTTTENGSVVDLYTVRLYTGSGAPEYVLVDTELPAGGNQYDHPVNGVLWAALAEKAYAVANGAGFVTSHNVGTDSYAALKGGQGAWAFQAITGNSARRDPLGWSDPASDWQSGRLIALGSKATTTNIAGGKGGILNIVGNHEYAIVGYDPSSKLFTLFNPWGTKGATVNGVMYAGLFTATRAQLDAAFNMEDLGA
jgi:hypothetical protein